MTEEGNFKSEIVDNKNKNTIRCQYCNSLILKPMSSNYVEIEFNLPLVHQKNTNDIKNIEKELISSYWCIDDMFTFENIGYSNIVQNTKFLVCADCDMGPVGFYDFTTKKSYVALKRVKHVEK